MNVIDQLCRFRWGAVNAKYLFGKWEFTLTVQGEYVLHRQYVAGSMTLVTAVSRFYDDTELVDGARLRQEYDLS